MIGTNSEGYREQDNELTLHEYLEQERALEIAAGEALPGKFDQCTYGIGHINQQLFLCQSCLKDPNVPAVVCYSCSISCHSQCQLVELFEKRNFRCDCGNDAFRSKCKLTPRKAPTNELNPYNGRHRHNFFGRFCTCDQLYTEEMEEYQMYKCIVCEDWYHDQCIQKVLISPSSITHLMSLIFCAKLPKEEDFEEFICWFCVADNPNLQCLHGRANCFSYSEYISVNWNPTDISTDSICLSLQSPEPNLSSIFLKGNWRDLICKCDKCLPLFSSPNLEILLREAPTFEPEPDLEAMIPTYEIALKALNNFSDKTALDSRLYAYERLRSSLSSFLLELSKHKKVVTKEVCTSDAKCLSKLNMPWLVGH